MMTPTSTTRYWVAALALATAAATVSCRSVWTSTHGGVKYSIHGDQKFHRIEREKNGRLMYDSPELTVVSENGRLLINGQDSGPVNQGDHVVVSDIGTVLVNGERRGDTQTGKQENARRIRQAQALIEQNKHH